MVWWLLSLEMDTATWVQILYKAVCISHNANIIKKDINQAMGKLKDRLGSLTLVWQSVLEKENSEFKPVKLCLKIGLVSYPARVGGVDKIHRSFF